MRTKQLKRSLWIPVTMLVAGVLPVQAQGTFGKPVMRQALIGPGPIGAATTTARFAHIAIGGGFTTLFTFLNTGAGLLTGELLLSGQDGRPLNANLTSGASPSAGPSQAAGTLQVVGSSIPLSIPPGGMQLVNAAPVNPGDSTRAGWARVESEGGTIAGVGTFQLASSGTLLTIAGVLSSEPVETATIPVDDDVPANRFTGYAVANPSSTESITIRVQTVQSNGTPGAALSSITLGPGEQVARFVFQDPAASQRFQGSAVLIGPAGKKFIVVALVQNQGLFTAIPVVPARAPNIN